MSEEETPEVRTTPCCGYRWQLGASEAVNKGPIFWNPYNDVVQCHNCGAGFVEIEPGRTDA